MGKTQAEVKAKLKTAIEEAGGLDVARAGKYTVAEWLRLWFEVYAKPNLRFSTAEYYRRGIELHTVTLINERREGHGQHDIPFAQVFVMGGCREFPGGGTIKQRGQGMHKIQLFHISFFWE